MLVCVRTKIGAVHLYSEDLEFIFSIFEENKVLIFQGIYKPKVGIPESFNFLPGTSTV